LPFLNGIGQATVSISHKNGGTIGRKLASIFLLALIYEFAPWMPLVIAKPRQEYQRWARVLGVVVKAWEAVPVVEEVQ
jgi:hypothetical protein